MFAYGQTGSGKTHTMMGKEGDDMGVLPRICEQIFKKVGYLVEVAAFEIYCETFIDLLQDKQQDKTIK